MFTPDLFIWFSAAGIPDFRSPGKGLYHNLAKYNLPYPQAIFELVYFLKQPEPFFQIARELFPGSFHPTAAHYFLKLLQEKGLLLRHYTQVKVIFFIKRSCRFCQNYFNNFIMILLGWDFLKQF